MKEDRCKITGNLYGTDTITVGRPCPCQVCKDMEERCQCNINMLQRLKGIDICMLCGKRTWREDENRWT